MKDGGLEALKPPKIIAASAVAGAVATSSPPLPLTSVTAAAAIMDAKTTTTSAVPPSEQTRKWNTKNLPFRLGTDLVSAASAAVLVAPIISIIDRSIMENASGRATLLNSVRSSFRTFLTSPQKILLSKPFALIFALYGGTYLTANTLDTYLSTTNPSLGPPSYVSSGPGKFFASSTANIGMCIYKDQVFVRLFGPPGTPRPVTLPSYILFALRDCMTIFASFNMPGLLGPKIEKGLSEGWKRSGPSGSTIAQFVAPAAVQVLSTPVHLWGLDIYNRPEASRAERIRQVARNWGVSTVARICRIVPAFGVGGVVNLKVRRGLMGRLE
ncbi:hypothetical protein QBC40DRAFT_71639 [Triangularia verruculosa]|uniref:Sequence orphan n=1 Tax=Triangularia verruculosa TaxID=2587418 RepID=A0AAN6XGX3_9PEZI|nr:hypothetical protein QBC40DRAFT_71639 [Triangularia verruculosa]